MRIGCHDEISRGESLNLENSVSTTQAVLPIKHSSHSLLDSDVDVQSASLLGLLAKTYALEDKSTITTTITTITTTLSTFCCFVRVLIANYVQGGHSWWLVLADCCVRVC